MIILVANIKGGMARTTVSVMLARAFSQTGKRVTLVGLRPLAWCICDYR